MVPTTHPRYKSLLNRDMIVEAFESGVLAKGGMIAHGRGETFDYLLGETTTPEALESIKVTAALMVLSKNPVISVNGNSVALAKDEFVSLAKELNGKIEVNLFYRTAEREQKIKKLFEEDVKSGIVLLGIDDADKQIPGVDHLRGKVSESGIYTADVVLVPLEDGDRAEALVKMGKTVIAIDLNPLSRTARRSTISIVDELTRCVPLIRDYVIEYKKMDRSELVKIVENYKNDENLKNTLRYISNRLNSMDLS